jgi:hypothetical protein
MMNLQCDAELRNAFLTFINSFNLLICVRCVVTMRGEGQTFPEAHVYVNSSVHTWKWPGVNVDLTRRWKLESCSELLFLTYVQIMRTWWQRNVCMLLINRLLSFETVLQDIRLVLVFFISVIFVTWMLNENFNRESVTLGRAIAQAVSRWLPIAAARLRSQVKSRGICSGQSGAGVGFLRVLRFPQPILIPPTAPHLSSIVRCWYNRPISGRHTK